MNPSTSCRPLKITTADGVGISAQDWGNASGPEIIFVHGMLQCHLSWSKQFDSPLALKFRLITYDFRGHGGSDKPVDANYYNDSAKFAEELRAVMDAAGVRRPILVGWSFGTRIIADYLLKFGSAGLAGLNLVAPVMSPNPEHFGPGIKKLAKSRDADFATSISGIKEFLRACFVNQPARDEMETMLVYSASVPLEIRRSFGRSASDTETLQALMRSLDVPVLISHGLEDQVILPELSRWLTAMIPTAELSLYQESGHAPFFEESARFNRELEAFAARTSQGS